MAPRMKQLEYTATHHSRAGWCRYREELLRKAKMTPPPLFRSLRQPLILFLSLRIYLFWGLHGNGVIYCRPFLTGLHPCRDPRVPGGRRHSRVICVPSSLPSATLSPLFLWHLVYHTAVNERPPCLKRMLQTPPSPIFPFSAEEAETLSAVTCLRSPDFLAAELGMIS